MTWVMENSRSTENDRLVLIAIANEADDFGFNAWPGKKRLESASNSSKSTVTRSLKRLEALGELIVARRSGRRASNHYALVMDRDWHMVREELAREMGNKPCTITDASLVEANEKVSPVNPFEKKEKVSPVNPLVMHNGVSSDTISTQKGVIKVSPVTPDPRPLVIINKNNNTYAFSARAVCDDDLGAGDVSPDTLDPFREMTREQRRNVLASLREHRPGVLNPPSGARTSSPGEAAQAAMG